MVLGRLWATRGPADDNVWTNDCAYIRLNSAVLRQRDTLLLYSDGLLGRWRGEVEGWVLGEIAWRLQKLKEVLEVH